MRGDPLACQWRVERAIEASPKGLTVAEPGKEKETGISIFSQNVEAFQAAGFPLYTEKVDRVNRWAFIDTFKFKIPAPFTLTELMSPYVDKGLVRVLKHTPFYGSLDSFREKGTIDV